MSTCRSGGTCRRRRGRATASARSRAGPRPPAPRGRRASARPGRSRRPRCCSDAVDEDLERRLRPPRAGRPDSALPRSIRCQSACAGPPLSHSLRASARSRRRPSRYAGNGGFLPGERPFAERAPHRQTRSSSSRSSPGVIFVIVEGALIAFIIKYRRGKRAAHGRGPADPRLDAARDHLDGRPGRDPRGDRRVRLLRAARHRRRAEGRSAPTRRRSRSRGISSTGSSATRTAPSRSTAMVAPADEVVHEDVNGARLRRHPLLVGARPRRQDRRDPGRDEQDVVQGAGRRRTSRAAPSSAGSSTR